MSYAMHGRQRAARRSTLTPWLAAALALSSTALPSEAQEVSNGTMLVASPSLEDPNFARSVVLVLRHDDNGTVGLIINRPTNLEPAAVFPELAEGLGTYTGHLFRGGPIAPTRVLFLVQGLAAATVEGPEILDKVFLGINPEGLADMTRLAAGEGELRMYAGHAAWVPGQLEAEIDAGGWQLLPGTAELVFDAQPSDLWPELEGRAPAPGEVVAQVRAGPAD